MDIIGQWNQSFIITKLGGDIFAIDQHAANEALNFEDLRKNYNTLKQKLIEPIILNLSPEEIENAEIFIDKCKEYGFDYLITDHQLYVYSIPSNSSIASGSNDLKELLNILQENPNSIPLTYQARKNLSYKACRSSVMVGDTMSKKKMKNLLDLMSNSDFPWNCPHGRPTWCQIWSLNNPLFEKNLN